MYREKGKHKQKKKKKSLGPLGKFSVQYMSI